ncbi:hypothetical protein ACI3KY_06010 [Microbacterium sp. ZW T2_14]|uniref:hypothetical protein n=1 Tax=Microbacterium sp. ZW T2_14 TaxID=3378079 RepID=UPI0038538ED2
MTDSVTEATPRIRWGWFVACILLGSAGIVLGLLLAPPAERWGYLAGVLGGVGTTLLLVGIVLLLERRIIDGAVKVVRDAAEEARIRSDRVMRTQVRDLENRITDLWATTATPEDVARKQQETSRMAHEFTERLVSDYTGEPEHTVADPHQDDPPR